MTNEKLSKRLQKVGDFVPENARLLDIGSDHAYLPIHLVQSGKLRQAIAGEVVQGPYQSACANVAASELSDQISVRLANGLAAFDPTTDEVDTITISGMGGHLIADILSADVTKLGGIKTLILQPNNGEAYLRGWLQKYQFEITTETILEENNKIYEIIVAQPTKAVINLTKDELVFGRFLKQQKSVVFLKKWQSELVANQVILSKIPISAPEKRQEFIDKIAKIEEMLDVSK